MPTETAKPRLIDANALIESLKELEAKMRIGGEYDSFCSGIVRATHWVESAPTVETTDDVLSRLHGVEMCERVVNGIGTWYARDDEKRFVTEGKTPLEAVKRLEESLNRK